MNSDVYDLELTRIEICDLMLACTSVEFAAKDEMKHPDCPKYRRECVLPATVKKWAELHDKLKAQLDALDAKGEVRT